MKTEQNFILENKKAFNLVERFKAKLENKGFRVIVTLYGFNGVKITGY